MYHKIWPNRSCSCLAWTWSLSPRRNWHSQITNFPSLSSQKQLRANCSSSNGNCGSNFAASWKLSKKNNELLKFRRSKSVRLWLIKDWQCVKNLDLSLVLRRSHWVPTCYFVNRLELSSQRTHSSKTSKFIISLLDLQLNNRVRNFFANKTDSDTGWVARKPWFCTIFYLKFSEKLRPSNLVKCGRTHHKVSEICTSVVYLQKVTK